MPKNFLKNIDFASVQPFAGLVSFQQGQVVSRTLAQNKAVSLTLFAFDQGEEISTHASGGDALVVVLEGEGRITVGGKEFSVKPGESIAMPANVPHAVFAAERFKMFLAVVFPQENQPA